MGIRIARLGLFAMLLAALGPLCAWAAERPVSPAVKELAVEKPATSGPASALAGVWGFDLPGRDEKFQVFNAPTGARQPSGVMTWKYNDANRPAGLFPDKNAVISQIQSSMSRWSATCSITFVYQGETSIGLSLPGSFDSTNVIGWDATSMPLPTTTTGVTYIGWNGSNVIVDADVHLNANYNPQSAFDATVTHEVGHAIGLNHSQFPGHLMSGLPDSPYRNNGIATLDQDDIDGCVFLYGAPGGGPPPPDTLAPTVPTGLTATVVSSTAINLAWTASTDNVGVTGYNVYANGSLLVPPVASAGAAVSGLTPSTLYSFTVSACDAATNCSAQSAPVVATTQAAGPPPDTQAPTVPTGLTATVVSSSAINLAWTASTDNVGVTSYKIFSGTQIGVVAGTAAAVTSLAASTMYSFTVSACDAAANCSAQSAPVSATTQSSGTPSDTQAPTVPTGLTATVLSSSAINLAWTASTDNVGVTGYKVFQNGTLRGTVSSAGASITSLSASTTYSFTVSACDAAGNCSAQSAVASATTQAVQSTVDYSGAWYDASESGWGLSVVRGSLSGLYGIIMYHYDQSSSPTWYWMSGGSFNGNVYSAPVTLYSGPYFGGPFNPALVTHPQVGSATINFTSATTATISYTISGITVTKDITKLDF